MYPHCGGFYSGRGAVLGVECRDPSVVPSVMVGKPVPVFDLVGFNLEEIGGQGEGLSKGLNSGDFLIKNNTQNNINNNVQVLNFFASWCVPCRAEHGQLVLLAEQYGFILYGINYKDKVADARAWLGNSATPMTKSAWISMGVLLLILGLRACQRPLLSTPKALSCTIIAANRWENGGREF